MLDPINTSCILRDPVNSSKLPMGSNKCFCNFPASFLSAQWQQRVPSCCCRWHLCRWSLLVAPFVRCLQQRLHLRLEDLEGGEDGFREVKPAERCEHLLEIFHINYERWLQWIIAVGFQIISLSVKNNETKWHSVLSFTTKMNHNSKFFLELPVWFANFFWMQWRLSAVRVSHFKCFWLLLYSWHVPLQQVPVIPVCNP